MQPPLSEFSQSLQVEGAFVVLAVARQLKARGKDVVELEIGDSPFPSPRAATAAGMAALEAGDTHYGPSPGLPELRAACAQMVRDEFQIPATAENVVVASGAKIFEQYFCETFLNPGDGVLVFSPQFPTYLPNILRRGARMVTATLRESRQFRPDPADVLRFLETDPSPKAIFLNFPHNPTGGCLTPADATELAEIVRRHPVAVFSDEPYCHMVWDGRHTSLLAEPGLLDQCVGAYTFSKSYSMSGWRLGFAVASPAVATVLGKLINTSLSCSPPFVQRGGLAALSAGRESRETAMQAFAKKVARLSAGLAAIPGMTVTPPRGTFYVFPNVSSLCKELGLTSHGLAMYLLEGADDQFGVACLGGECFGEAGQGFLRFSCAEPDERIQQAVDFLPIAISRRERVAAYLETHPEYRLG